MSLKNEIILSVILSASSATAVFMLLIRLGLVI
jgi:hypothetical protein